MQYKQYGTLRYCSLTFVISNIVYVLASTIESDTQVEPSTPDLLSTLLNPDVDNEKDIEQLSSGVDTNQEEKGPDSVVDLNDEPAPDASKYDTADKLTESENKQSTLQQPLNEGNRKDQASEQRDTSENSESDRDPVQVQSEEAATPNGVDDKADATREEGDISDKEKDATESENGTVDPEADPQDSANVSGRKLLEDVNRTTDEETESATRDKDLVEERREANARNEDVASTVSEEVEASNTPDESEARDEQDTNQADSKPASPVHTIRDPSPEATRTEPIAPELSDADVSIDTDTQQQGAHDTHQSDSQDHQLDRSSSTNVPYDVGNEDSRAALLELCHNQQNLPACEQLRGAKIYRGKDRNVESIDDSSEPVINTEKEQEIGKLDRLWRNLGKLMNRIKLMKLAFVKLFHGPLSVMGLEEVNYLMFLIFPLIWQ